MVKSLRAIILFVIYAAFVSGSLIASPLCGDLCSEYGLGHSAFGSEGNVPPGECSEKEAINNLPTEHRVGSSVRLANGTRRNAPSPGIDDIQPANCQARLVPAAANLTPVVVPLYIANCVYRL